MSATIEHLPRKWTSDAAKQVYDLLRTKMTEAMTPPPSSATWSAAEFETFWRTAKGSVEWMSVQCIALHDEFTAQVIRINISAGT